MAGLFGAKGSSFAKPNYTSIQVQTSANTLPIPIGWGQVRLAPNLIWEANFQTHAQSQSGKGGPSVSSYTYTSDIMMGLCEGPISGIVQIWSGSDIYTDISKLGLTLFAGTNPQAVWGYLASKYPGQALAYNATGYVAAPNYNLGGSPSLPNHNYEIKLKYRGTGANGVDADIALVINDALTSDQYGAGMTADEIDSATLFGAGGDASLQTYCKALGICFSPLLSSVETAQSVLQRWLQIANCGAVWSDGKLKFVPYGDQAVTGNGVTYTPNLTPVYDFSESDYQGDGSEDPLTLSRIDLYEAYNVTRITVRDRSNAYNSTPIECRDEAAVNTYGIRIDTGVQADEICDVNVASIVGQLMLQRGLYVRRSANFKLGWNCCRLDPMDYISLSEVALGLAAELFQVDTIEEDDNGILTVMANEVPIGVATATAYARQGVTGNAINTAIATGAVNPPAIFEPPPQFTGGTAQIVIGLSASVSGQADPNWGGANILVSIDAAEFEDVGQVTQPARQGVLIADLAAYGGANPDNTNTLAVDLTQSGGTLNSAATGGGALGTTLCLVGTEILGYQTATLIGADQYDLTTLYRGQDGSTGVLSPAGTPFCRLDSACFTYDLPSRYIGVPLYFKFQSFNIYGTGEQDPSTCVIWDYTPAGVGYVGPVAASLSLGTPMDFGLASATPNEFDDFGLASVGVASVVIDLGLASS